MKKGLNRLVTPVIFAKLGEYNLSKVQNNAENSAISFKESAPERRMRNKLYNLRSSRDFNIVINPFLLTTSFYSKSLILVKDSELLFATMLFS